jgi:replicative DNA helicase
MNFAYPSTPREKAAHAVIAAIQLSPAATPFVMNAGLLPEHFYHERERAAYTWAMKMHDAGQVVTQPALEQGLRALGGSKNPTFRDAAEATHWINCVAGASLSASELGEYVRLLKEEALWEAMQRSTHEAQSAIFARDEEAWWEAWSRIGHQVSEDERLDAAALLRGYTEWLDSEEYGISTPFERITQGLRGGFKPGDTTILAGWSSMGKSALAGQLIMHAADHNASVREYVNEMSAHDRLLRMIARKTLIPLRRLVMRQLDDREHKMAKEAAADYPGEIIPCAGWPAEKIARSIRRHRDDFAVLDLVTLVATERGDTRDLDHVSQVLTSAARQSGTHLVMVAQLNQARSVTASRPVPVARDLRGTGSWYNDARNVMFIHLNEEVVDGRAYQDGGGLLVLDKASNGSKTVQPVEFEGDHMRFLSKAVA